MQAGRLRRPSPRPPRGSRTPSHPPLTFCFLFALAFGARSASPVPLALFVLGGAAVVLLSFAVVYRREVTDDSTGVLEDVIVPPRAGPVASAGSVLVLALLVLAGLLGSQEVAENI